MREAHTECRKTVPVLSYTGLSALSTIPEVRGVAADEGQSRRAPTPSMREHARNRGSMLLTLPTIHHNYPFTGPTLDGRKKRQEKWPRNLRRASSKGRRKVATKTLIIIICPLFCFVCEYVFREVRRSRLIVCFCSAVFAVGRASRDLGAWRSGIHAAVVGDGTPPSIRVGP